MAVSASAEAWSASANEVTSISLVRPKTNSPKLESLYEFHPEWTYPIFGEHQEIFGYKQLAIQIQFAAHNCYPHLNVSYSKKFPANTEVGPDDINGSLRKFLPAQAFEQEYSENIISDDTSDDWLPPGRLVNTYSKKGRTFEVWAGSLLDPNVRQLVDNVQIFITFYIEGGSPLPINTDPEWALERWQVYFLYERLPASSQHNQSPYVFCGYATTWRPHRFIRQPERPSTTTITTLDALEEVELVQQPCRCRISQFVILPPFQKSGHGSALYSIIYKEALADSAVTELTVEDPSEEFDLLRDMNDFRTLEPQLRAADIKLNIDPDWSKKTRFEAVPYKDILPRTKLEQIRLVAKIEPRQFNRMLEMYLYSNIPYSHRDPIGANTNSNTKLLIQKHKTANMEDRKFYWWRVVLRSRIYLHNLSLLRTLSPDEQRQHIVDAGRGQQDEYEGLLMKMAEKEVREVAQELAQNGSSSSSRPSGGTTKRKTIIDDDDDEEDGDESSASAPKKAKRTMA